MDAINSKKLEEGSELDVHRREVTFRLRASPPGARHEAPALGPKPYTDRHRQPYSPPGQFPPRLSTRPQAAGRPPEIAATDAPRRFSGATLGPCSSKRSFLARLTLPEAVPITA